MKRLVFVLTSALFAAGATTCAAFGNSGQSGPETADGEGVDALDEGSSAGDAAIGDAASSDARAVYDDPVLVGTDTNTGNGIFVCAMDIDAFYIGGYTDVRRMEKDGGASRSLGYGVDTSTILDMMIDDGSPSLFWLSSPFIGNTYLVRGATAGGGAVIGARPKMPSRFAQTATTVFATQDGDGIIGAYAKATWGADDGGVFAVGNFSGPLATDGTNVFAAEGSDVLSFRIAGPASPTKVVSSDGGIVDLEIDRSAGVLFWATHDTIGVTDIASAATTLISPVSVNLRITFDATDIYWADTGGQKIVRVLRGGGGKQILDANGQPVWVGIDGAGAWWCNTDGSVYLARRK